MAEWQLLDLPDAVCTDRSEKRGVGVELGASPFDIPDAVRSTIESAGRVRIQFKYIGANSEKLREFQQEGVSIELGDRSGRIFDIVIDGSYACQPTVLAKLHAVIAKAYEKVSCKPRDSVRRLNDVLAKTVIEGTLRECRRLGAPVSDGISEQIRTPNVGRLSELR